MMINYIFKYIKGLLQIRKIFGVHKSRLVQFRVLGDSLTQKGQDDIYHLPGSEGKLPGVTQRLANILQDTVITSRDNGCNTLTSGPAQNWHSTHTMMMWLSYFILC